MPGCSRPKFVQENGQSHDFCGKLHAQMFKDKQISGLHKAVK